MKPIALQLMILCLWSGVAVATDWPFNQPVRHPLPTTKASQWERTWVDAFVLRELHARNLMPGQDASASTLLRRLHFVLHGLPPSAEDLQAFRPAFERDADRAIADKVDQLLGSRAFGERFGRHWLDVVRYADSNGGGANRVFENAWRYRDYVLRAFAQDKPFDQFIREQLSGDLLDGGYDAIVATGFLSIGPKEVAEYDKAQLDLDVTDEQLDTIGRAFMGLTFGCARCHDHKFDPVSQRDYYAMAGVLLSTETLLRKNAGGPLSVWNRIPLSNKRHALGPRDREQPADMHLLRRGNRLDPGELVPRGIPAVMGGHRLAIPKGESGRRQLAEWIASERNHLTSRIAVNRIWQWCLGNGIVRSVDNFGVRGTPPSHPELLDSLAVEFAENNWSVKAIVRLILNSRVFRLSSQVPAATENKDPANRYLSHASRRRHDAESLRDHLLAHAGLLDRASEGDTLTWGGRLDEGQAKRRKEQNPRYRRAVYLPRFRGFAPNPMLTAFDVPEPSLVTGSRAETLQPAQALVMLNSPLVREAAEAIARRWSGDELYLNLLGRRQSERERQSDHEFLNAGGTRAELVQSILASNEYLYVD